MAGGLLRPLLPGLQFAGRRVQDADRRGARLYRARLVRGVRFSAAFLHHGRGASLPAVDCPQPARAAGLRARLVRADRLGRRVWRGLASAAQRAVLARGSDDRHQRAGILRLVRVVQRRPVPPVRRREQEASNEACIDWIAGAGGRPSGAGRDPAGGAGRRGGGGSGDAVGRPGPAGRLGVLDVHAARKAGRAGRQGRVDR